MKEKELNDLLDKAIGTKGHLRIPAYWMRKIFQGLMEWCKTATPKVEMPYVPTNVSELTNDVPYANEPLVYNRSSYNNPSLELNGITIISNKTGDLTFNLTNVKKKFSYYILQLDTFEGAISFSNANIHWETPLPQHFDPTNKYLITLKSVDGYNFFGTYLESPIIYEFKLTFTSETDEHRPLYNPNAVVLSMNIDGEELEPKADFQFTPGTHEVIIRTNNTAHLFENTAFEVGSSSGGWIWTIDTLELPIGLTRISENFLSSSFGITNLRIPDSVNTLENYALANTHVTSAYIPDIEYATATAFRRLMCDTFQGPLASSDGKFLVAKNGTLLCMKAPDTTSYVTFPDNITSVSGDTLIFDYTSGVDFNNVEYISSVNSYGSDASLKSVRFGPNIKSIGDSVFRNKAGLETVYCAATTPPTITSKTFAGCSKLKRIYVPSKYVTDYKNAPNWSTFSSYIYGYSF